jgi:hypothetical protein
MSEVIDSLPPVIHDQGKGMERCELKVQTKSHIHTLGNVIECEGMSPHTPSGLLL